MKPKIKAGTVTARIVEELGSAIVMGEYREGEVLPVEAELCMKFGASRSVVREAVKIMSAKGLLSTVAGRGTVIEQRGHWNLLDPDVLYWMLQGEQSEQVVLDFLEIRYAIEPEAAALAARRATDEDKAAIEAAIEGMRSAEKGDGDALESDIAFHVAILNASGNPFYVQLSSLVESALRISIRITNEAKGVTMGDVDDHATVAQKIMSGDAASARRRMQELIHGPIFMLQGDERQGDET